MGGLKKIMSESASSPSWNTMCEPIDLSCAVAATTRRLEASHCHDHKEPLDLSVTPARPQTDYMDYRAFGSPSEPSNTFRDQSGYGQDSRYACTREWSPPYNPCVYSDNARYNREASYEGYRPGCREFDAGSQNAVYQRTWHEPEPTCNSGAYNYPQYPRKSPHRKSGGYSLGPYGQADVRRQRSPWQHGSTRADPRLLSGDFYRQHEDVFCDVMTNDFSRNVAYTSGGGFSYSQPTSASFPVSTSNHGNSVTPHNERYSVRARTEHPSTNYSKICPKTEPSPDMFITSNTLCAGGCVVSSDSEHRAKDNPAIQPIHIPLHLLAPCGNGGATRRDSGQYTHGDIGRRESTEVDLKKVKMES